MLAPLAGRIYVHAPQQNAFPLANATSLMKTQIVVTPDPPRLTRLQVTGLLAVGGAITGSVALVTIIGLASLVQGVSPFDHARAIYPFVAFMGAAFGLLAAPIAGWMFFRAAPLGWTALVTAAGTIIGAVLGELFRPAVTHSSQIPGIVIGAGVGFLLGGLAILAVTAKRRASLRGVG